MKKRFKMARGKSKRDFSKKAGQTHVKNMPRKQPMRGGIRL